MAGNISGGSKQYQIFFDFSKAEYIQDVFIYDPFLTGVNMIAVHTLIDGSYQSCGNIAQSEDYSFAY